MKKELSLKDIPRELVDFFFEVQPPLDLPFSTVIKKARDKHSSLYSRYTLLCKSQLTSKLSLGEISVKYDLLVKNINEVLMISVESSDNNLIASMRELSSMVEEVGLSIWAHYYSVAYGMDKLLR